ncbi:MAG: ribosomal protein S18-alanine N-acetyltransferase, partial [Candidatus Vecturithrix sp.]|nr:ribosomal protein S18-alanine N-acetyltransferase [Candidatus Vecturithrix sp.]
MNTGDLHVQFMSAQKTDIEQIEAIEQRAYPFPWARNVLLEEIEGESFSYVYVARLVTASGQPGAIIGYHFFWLISDEIHILNIAVDPEYQGCGLGTRLMQFAINFGKERGATCALLEVRVSNLPAQQLYAKLGFKRIGLRKRYYSDNKEDA